MLQPMRRPNRAREATASPEVIPVPSGGWNRRDPVAKMPATDALHIENFIPEQGKIRLRRGCFRQSNTHSGTQIGSMMVYSPTNGTEQLFVGKTVASVAGIYPHNSATASVGSLTSDVFYAEQFANSAASWLVVCNGTDTPQKYDGSSWSDAVITGVTSSTLIYPVSYQRRLFFLQTGSLKVYYLSAEAVQGAATAFDLGPLCKKGGYLLAAGTWTRDGGDGPDDVILFVTSNGEVVIFVGIDPSDATTWQLVGVFQIPPPVGRRCIVKFGAEVLVLTAAGLLPLTQVLPQSGSSKVEAAITNKIEGPFADAYRVGKSLGNWQVIEYPKANWLVCNIPLTGTTSETWVFNLESKGWTRITGWHAAQYVVWNGALTFTPLGTRKGNIYEADRGYGDFADSTTAGSAITAIVVPAYSLFRSAKRKRLTACRLTLEGAGRVVPEVKTLVDYDTRVPIFSGAAVLATVTGTLWNEAVWNVSLWTPGTQVFTPTLTLGGIGVSLTVGIRVSSIGQELAITSIQVLRQDGEWL